MRGAPVRRPVPLSRPVIDRSCFDGAVASTSPCPEVPFWNLTLRFGLEIAALVGLTVAAAGRLAVPLVVATPIVAGSVWGMYNVPGDSSRSGKAFRAVPGFVRLAIELTILLGAAWALIATGRPTWGWILGALVVLHLVFSLPRVRWMLGFWPASRSSV